ncbi:MAG: ferritin family protein [Thermococcus sp.]|uniref:ferritin-like domain-containing protein n=1 Tax=Thermococcus sp. TaxID=35749 RepID=UPI001D46FB83|nr:ferritin family protein [Thermococcus sp.]MBO8173721.1 ferritin family protein [Thermococcus sp.]
MESPLDVFMKKAEIEEKVKKTLKQITKLPLKDILSYVIKGEKDATALYIFLYENVPSPYLKERFKQFVEIEKSHDRKVTEIFKTLYPNEEPKDIPFKSWKKIFEEREYKLKTVKDYLDVLEIAMEAERLAEEVYLYLEKNVENPEHKKIFLELAKDERDHYEFVSGEYEFYEKAKAEQELQELIRELSER